MGLGEEQDLVGATSQGQVGLEFLPSSRGLSWSSALPTQSQMSASHLSLPHAPGLEGRGPRGPCPLSPDYKGRREVRATLLCESKHSSSESCPARAGAATKLERELSVPGGVQAGVRGC